MSFLELAKKRYSVRSYKDVPVEKEKIMQVLEAGRIAPSAVNYQPWFFIVVQDQALKEKVFSTYSRKWIEKAPAIIVVCGDHNKSWKRELDDKDHCDIDVAIAIDHMSLAAVDLGMGSCWVCKFDAKQCHEILQLPSHLEVVALLPIGYPAEEADINRHDIKRKKLDEIVSWNGI